MFPSISRLFSSWMAGAQSRAVRQRHCVKKNRRRCGVGGQKHLICFRTNFVLSSKLSDNLFLVTENCNKITTQQQWHRRRADKLSAAAPARRTTKGGGAFKLSARGAAG